MPYRSLPLTQLHQFTGKTPPGIWLYLLGEKQQGNNAIAYGRLVYYDPKTSDLSLMLPWTSPLGKAPRWQQVTSSNSSELIIDETVDFEPRLKVYQVKTVRPGSNFIQLEEISLLTPALNLSAYRDALFLARNGLWSPAWKWLQSIEQQQRKSWSASAQAQMEPIHLYAQFTQNQAAQTWVSPSQQVLTYLIDGRKQQTKNTQPTFEYIDGLLKRIENSDSFATNKFCYC